MQEATARFIVQIIENRDEEATIHEDYSGRGMYGKTTFAVVMDTPQRLTQALANFVLENGSDELTDDQEEALDEIASGFRSDSMANDVIIY